MQRILDKKEKTPITTINIPINNEDFLCPIPQELLKNPVETQCGHVFESKEIADWHEKDDACPQCRDNIVEIRLPSQQILGLKTEAEVLKDEYSSRDFSDQAPAASASYSSTSSASNGGFFGQPAPSAPPAEEQPRLQSEQPYQSFLQPR